MVWKPKEKELTREEAVAQARAELTPFWIGSPPLIAGVRAGGEKSKVYPLDSGFLQKSWIVLFCDPFSFDGVGALGFLKEWVSRYSNLGLNFLLILKSDLKMDSQSRRLFNQFKKYGIECPVVIDADGALGEAFKVDTSVKMALLSKGKTVLEQSSLRGTSDWFQKIETEIQKFLRKEDIGLPLSPVFAPESPPVVESERILLGSNSPDWVKRVKLEGKHQIHSNYVVIHDNSASISVEFESSYLGIVARGTSKSGSPTKIVVEVDGKPAYDTFSDRDLSFDESGFSFVGVSEMNLYLLLKGVRRQRHELKLLFPGAEFNPVELYRLALGD